MKDKIVPRYKNPEADIDERVKDLLGRMDLEQKVAQLNCIMAIGGAIPDAEQMKNGIGQVSVLFAGQSTGENARCMDGIQRYLLEQTELGIPALIHAEGLSGAVLAEATNFPVAIGLGATWDSEKLGKMGGVIRRQMRAVGVNQAFVPVLDVARDLRWGRVGETYGECPALTAKMGVSYVRGVQGTDMKDGVAATSKHFLGYAQAASVELLLNGKSLGRKKIKECKAIFKVKYAPGTLEAIAYDGNDREISRGKLNSATGKASIAVRTESETAAAGQVVYVPVEIVGENGVVESNADRTLTVTVEGGELLAFGSANPCTQEQYHTGTFTTYYGRALAAVRVERDCTVTVTDGNQTSQVVVAVR